MRFQAVLFDGYGTLFEGAMGKLMETCAGIVREQDLQMTPEAFLKVWDRFFFPMLREGEFVTFRDAHIESLDRVFEALNVSHASEPYTTGLLKLFSEVSAFEDVQPTLDGLDGHVTAVVSNADSDHLEAALIRNGLRFRVVVSSESARCYKPNPEIFHTALELIGCSAEEVLYVGDSQEDDIVGTRRAGVKVAWLNREGEALKAGIPKPEYEIRSLREVLEIAK